MWGGKIVLWIWIWKDVNFFYLWLIFSIASKCLPTKDEFDKITLSRIDRDHSIQYFWMQEFCRFNDRYILKGMQSPWLQNSPLVPKFIIYFLPNAFCLAKSLVNIIPRGCADDKKHLYYELSCLHLTALEVNIAFQVLKALHVWILMPDNKIPLPISLTSSSGQ